MDRRSVIRHYIQRISRRYDLFTLLAVASLARSQFTPGTPNIVPQECNEFDCGETIEQQQFVPQHRSTRKQPCTEKEDYK